MPKATLQKKYSSLTRKVEQFVVIESSGPDLILSLANARDILRTKVEIECCLAQVIGQIH